MKVLLTGGSGNLGQALVPRLLDKGDTPVILDVRAPASLNEGAVYIEGSVLDRSKLTDALRGRSFGTSARPFGSTDSYPSSLLTQRWREMDSNHRFRATRHRQF